MNILDKEKRHQLYNELKSIAKEESPYLVSNSVHWPNFILQNKISMSWLTESLEKEIKSEPLYHFPLIYSLTTVIDNLLRSLLWWRNSKSRSWIHGLWQSEHHIENSEASCPSHAVSPDAWICYFKDYCQGKCTSTLWSRKTF